MKLTYALFLAGFAAAPLQAQEFVIGLGHADFKSNVDGGARVEVEYHGAERWTLGAVSFHFAAAALRDEPGNYFVGAGLGADLPLGDAGWFLHGSLMPGYYHSSGPGTDLGSDLEFRSLLGLGYRFASGWSVSAAASHLSNAGIGRTNPGVTAATIRVGRTF